MPDAPASGELDLNTLRLEYEYWREIAAIGRERITRVIGQVAASIATAGLVLGLFGAFRPETDDVLPNVLLVSGTVPFVAIVLVSIWGTFAIPAIAQRLGRREWWLYDDDLARGAQEQATSRIGTLALPETKDQVTARLPTPDSPPRAAAELMEYARLSEEAWLRVRIEEYAFQWGLMGQSSGRATDYQLLISLLLAFEVVYLVIVTSLTPFIT